MAGVYSTCFLDSAFTTLPAIQSYTCPDGFVAVLRNITVFSFCRSAEFGLHGALPLSVSILLTGSIVFALSPGNIRNMTYYWEGREVVESGDGFTVITSQNQFQYRLNGFLLKAP
jgi:hypothetical protein